MLAGAHRHVFCTWVQGTLLQQLGCGLERGWVPEAPTVILWSRGGTAALSLSWDVPRAGLSPNSGSCACLRLAHGKIHLLLPQGQTREESTRELEKQGRNCPMAEPGGSSMLGYRAGSQGVVGRQDNQAGSCWKGLISGH